MSPLRILLQRKHSVNPYHPHPRPFSHQGRRVGTAKSPLPSVGEEDLGVRGPIVPKTASVNAYPPPEVFSPALPHTSLEAPSEDTDRGDRGAAVRAAFFIAFGISVLSCCLCFATAVCHGTEVLEGSPQGCAFKVLPWTGSAVLGKFLVDSERSHRARSQGFRPDGGRQG